MKIAVDVMGGDYAPSAIIEGTAIALKDFSDIELVLVGHLGKISFYLEKFGLARHPRVSLVHAEEVVEMKDASIVTLRSKKNSSISVAARLMKNGEVDAIVSVGHTGAAVAATNVIVKPLPGVDRAPLASVMPAIGGHFILLDAGANTDCKALHLAQFAIMGETYCKHILGVENPTVGLLSIGEEDSKGNDLTKEAFKLLSKMPINFAGNVEGNDLFIKTTDVVVCDGFVGNVLIKACESLAGAINHWMKDVFTKNPVRKTGAILARSAFKDLKAIADAEEYGGIPLLGLNGICIIGHGSSNPKAVRNAIRTCTESVRKRINEKIMARIEESGMTFKNIQSSEAN
ncbi:MAG: hypothetical protein A2020_14625 [Lentisphaerae bacterium GWF2_45_14]|nr:MAG: hypothetical protein A2020_14625 [Lentisphaerae bacterium GWF2_45_14]